MDKPKRTRSDSSTASVKAAQAVAAGPLDPPVYCMVRECDRPFWDAIVCARARDSWNDVDLAKAANLARCQADIERISGELHGEGDTLVNERGTVVMNPKHSLLETLTRREIALSRVIHVHAEATVGESRDSSKSATAQKDAKKAAEAVESTGLIPGLRAVK